MRRSGSILEPPQRSGGSFATADRLASVLDRLRDAPASPASCVVIVVKGPPVVALDGRPAAPPARDGVAAGRKESLGSPAPASPALGGGGSATPGQGYARPTAKAALSAHDGRARVVHQRLRQVEPAFVVADWPNQLAEPGSSSPRRTPLVDDIVRVRHGKAGVVWPCGVGV